MPPHLAAHLAAEEGIPSAYRNCITYLLVT